MANFMARYRGGDGHYTDVECAYAELERYLILSCKPATGKKKATRIALTLFDLSQNPQPNELLKTAKPPAPPRLAALPYLPTCRVLGQHSLGCRTGVTFRPYLPFKRGTRQYDRVRIAPAWWRLSCDLLITCCWGVYRTQCLRSD